MDEILGIGTLDPQLIESDMAVVLACAPVDVPMRERRWMRLSGLTKTRVQRALARLTGSGRVVRGEYIAPDYNRYPTWRKV